ncbi:MAG: stage V sporulation protein AE [Ruminococcaceae bacterium]|nr:stage V sporulation protein AE [Oscillospiraceae bacterium]
MKYLLAFIIGGALCVIAQILLDKTKLSPARILVGYVVAGVFLGAIGIYPRILELAGAGAATPLTGFGNLIAEGVRKAVDRDGLIGALTGGLSAASAGIAAALCFGFIASIIFHGKNK